MNKPYKVYIDGLEIPVTPAKISNSFKGDNNFLKLLNGENFTVLKKPKLFEFKFSFYIFSHPHPGVDIFTRQETILDKLADLKDNKKAFEFVVLRTASDPTLRNSVCKNMTLEDYDIEEDTRHGTNAIVTVNLKEYQPLKTIKLEDKGNYGSTKKLVAKTVVADALKKAVEIPLEMVRNE